MKHVICQFIVRLCLSTHADYLKRLMLLLCMHVVQCPCVTICTTTTFYITVYRQDSGSSSHLARSGSMQRLGPVPEALSQVAEQASTAAERAKEYHAVWKQVRSSSQTVWSVLHTCRHVFYLNLLVALCMGTGEGGKAGPWHSAIWILWSIGLPPHAGFQHTAGITHKLHM